VNKYHAKKIIIDGEQFDSKAEYRRWRELKLLERAGDIEDLRRQVRFELIPRQTNPVTKELLERPVVYVADFVYFDVRSFRKVVEDVKGKCTPEYIIKRKLMLYLNDIQIREVRMR
jgi:hypothetical protein